MHVQTSRHAAPTDHHNHHNYHHINVADLPTTATTSPPNIDHSTTTIISSTIRSLNDRWQPTTLPRCMLSNSLERDRIRLHESPRTRHLLYDAVLADVDVGSERSKLAKRLFSSHSWQDRTVWMMRWYQYARETILPEAMPETLRESWA